MKLGDFLSQAGSSTPAPTKPVKFKILGRGPMGEQLVCDAEASLVFVDEHQRQEAIRDSHKAQRALYGADPVPPDRLDDEISYQFLLRALRTVEDPRVAFAASVRELRNALTLRTAGELMQTYNAFAAEEFPDAIDQKEFDDLVKEAESKSLAVLLSECGFSRIYRALPSLAGRFGK